MQYDKFLDIIKTKDYTKENKRFMLSFLYDVDMNIILYEIGKRVYIDNKNRICIEKL